MGLTVRISRSARRLPLHLAAAAILLVGAAGPFDAAAQEQRGWSLRELLFPGSGGRSNPPNDGIQTAKPPRTKARKPRAAPPRQPAAPVIAAVEKAPDARVVLVIGDFMASGLADGLETVFAQNAGVIVRDVSKGSSGFVREDVYNWPEQIKALIDSEKPAAVVVMLGSNDRQQMQVGDNSEPPRSDNWTKEYETRTDALAKAIADSKVPFLWVGLPAFKTARMTSDMLAFNDIYRSAAEHDGGEFVDVWDGFVDENGAFVATGPDINGQPVRLRSDDGINLAQAGKRKLAFYAEKPLMKILGLGAPAGVESASAPATPLPLEPPAAAATPAAVDRTQPMLLGDPALDGGTQLLGGAQPPKRDANSPGGKLVIEGIAPDAAPGRADDFSWPPKARAGTGDPDTTTAIGR